MASKKRQGMPKQVALFSVTLLLSAPLQPTELGQGFPISLLGKGSFQEPPIRNDINIYCVRHSCQWNHTVFSTKQNVFSCLLIHVSIFSYLFWRKDCHEGDEVTSSARVLLQPWKAPFVLGAAHSLMHTARSNLSSTRMITFSSQTNGQRSSAPTSPLVTCQQYASALATSGRMLYSVCISCVL